MAIIEQETSSLHCHFPCLFPLLQREIGGQLVQASIEPIFKWNSGKRRVCVCRSHTHFLQLLDYPSEHCFLHFELILKDIGLPLKSGHP